MSRLELESRKIYRLDGRMRAYNAGVIHFSVVRIFTHKFRTIASRKGDVELLDAAWQRFMNEGKVLSRDMLSAVYKRWPSSIISEFWKSACSAVRVAVRRHLVKGEKEDEQCCVCMEYAANTYIVHGDDDGESEAHMCVCSVCALELTFKGRPRCPICRGKSSSMIVCPNDRLACKCESDAERSECEMFLLSSTECFYLISTVFKVANRCRLSDAGDMTKVCRVFKCFN
jgi:hypothetical protein